MAFSSQGPSRKNGNNKTLSKKITNETKESKEVHHKVCYTSNVKVLYTNARSLTSGTKKDELQILINQEDINIAGITETWGRSDIMDCEMEIPGFKLYRKDRAAVNNEKGVE